MSKLRPKEAADEGLRRIAAEHLEAAISALGPAREGKVEAAAVYATRKEIKRLRAILRLARPSLPAGCFQRENQRLGDCGRKLGGSRDRAVIPQTWQKMQERLDPPLKAAEAHRFAARLEALVAAEGPATEAEQARDALDCLESAREPLAHALAAVGSLEELVKSLVAGYSRARKAYAKALAKPEPERFHQWRKRVKDLQAHCKLLELLWPPMLKLTSDQAGKVAKLLGEEHDLAVLGETLARGGAKLAPLAIRRRASKALAAAHLELRGRALRLGARLFAERKAAFERRMQAYLAAR
jgi:CHAD domain-containing protein